jgi:hypothetical protein
MSLWPWCCSSTRTWQPWIDWLSSTRPPLQSRSTLSKRQLCESASVCVFPCVFPYSHVFLHSTSRQLQHKQAQVYELNSNMAELQRELMEVCNAMADVGQIEASLYVCMQAEATMSHMVMGGLSLPSDTEPQKQQSKAHSSTRRASPPPSPPVNDVDMLKCIQW